MEHNGMHKHSFSSSTTVETALHYFLTIILQNATVTEEDVKKFALVKKEEGRKGLFPSLSLQDCGLRDGDIVRSWHFLFPFLFIVLPRHKVTIISPSSRNNSRYKPNRKNCVKNDNRFPTRTIIIEGRTYQYRLTTKIGLILSAIVSKLKLRNKKNDYCIVKRSQMNIPLSLDSSIQDLKIEDGTNLAGMSLQFVNE